jgi:uncharacterized protein YbbC (DUF1343 family)
LKNHPKLDRVNIDWMIQAYVNSHEPEQFFLNPGFRRHAGTTSLQLQIEKGMSASEIRDSWQSDIQDFLKIRKRYLIYP